MTNTFGLDFFEDLRSLCNDSYVVRELLSKIKRDTWVTTVDEAEDIASDISRQEIINGFKALARIGAGKFVIGRRGASSRIEWRHSPRSLGEAAQGEIREPVANGERDLVIDKSGRDDEVSRDKADWADWIDHKFQLRPKLEIAFKLPADFSSKEAERLAGFIRNLPFGE